MDGPNGVFALEGEGITPLNFVSIGNMLPMETLICQIDAFVSVGV